MPNESTFTFQRNLPSLPVPALRDTCERFLKWMKPLLSEEDLMELRSEVDQFMGENGEGRYLQDAIVRWSARPDISNWLEPFWMEEYLSPRHPAPIHGNVFYLLERNDNLNSQNPQLNRAALLIPAFLKFRKLVKEEELVPDMMRTMPLCMEPYRFLFSTTRIPGKDIDLLRLPDRGSFPTSENERHIVVFIHGRVFSLEVIDSDGKIISTSSILLALKEIKKAANTQGYGDSVGAMTSADRSSWFDVREKILRIAPSNGRSLDLIERALFALCLDNVSTSDDSQLGWSMLAGDCSNRWFDKSFQLIINNNGEAAVNMEHSAIDGSPMVRAAALVTDMEKEVFNQGGHDCSVWEEIKFTITDDIRETITETCSDFSSLASETILKVVEFSEFDRERIKTMGVSPDGFVQMAIQLAQFKLFGRCFNTYEPAMTRMFFHGRTEAIRVVSVESMAFVHAMCSDCVPVDNKEMFLRKAIETHCKRSKLCREGRGIDRHLLGLKKMWILEHGKDDLPAFFKTTAYRLLCENVISTSTTGAEGLKMAGFGPVCEDGFGVRYVHKKGLIRFTCTSRSHKSQELNALASGLLDALSAMGRILRSK